MSTRRKPAFSLLEILVVVAIIGLMASLIVSKTATARYRSRNAKIKSDISEAGKAIENYKSQANYSDQVIAHVNPGGDTINAISCGDAAAGTACDLFTGEINSLKKYPLKLNKTPAETVVYTYQTNGSPVGPLREQLPSKGVYVFSSKLLDEGTGALSDTYVWVKNGIGDSGQVLSQP